MQPSTQGKIIVSSLHTSLLKLFKRLLNISYFNVQLLREINVTITLVNRNTNFSRDYGFYEALSVAFIKLCYWFLDH